MLQDVEAGRGLEVNALIGAVIELGTIVGIPTPRLKAVYALTSLLGQSIDDAKAGLSLIRPGNQY
ncbi:MAG: hypothetical protein KGK17_06185 [Betaproteobacteria bacterium]|nr:hypothetical protein [Betaproteobacteria bacterium]